jgi:hypothetical protein
MEGVIINPFPINGIEYGFTTKLAKFKYHNYANHNDPKVQTTRKELGNLLKAKQISFLKQVHGNNVIEIEQTNYSETQLADGQLTKDSNITLTVQSADCLPILVYDYSNKIIAASHSGWRGTFLNIAENTINKLLKLGSKPEQLNIIIGPHINWSNYEVGEEFYHNFIEQDSNNQQFFVFQDNKIHFDNCKMVTAQLYNAQILKNNIYYYPHNTYSGDNFFSYRRYQQKLDSEYGSIISFIKLC